jgi:hypothetical protein
MRFHWLRSSGRPAIAAGLLAATVAATAAASPWWPVTQPQPTPQQPQDPAVAAFKAADTNNDNRLNREECARLPVVAARFAELDRNNDGYLDWEEFRAGYRSEA